MAAVATTPTHSPLTPRVWTLDPDRSAGAFGVRRAIAVPESGTAPRSQRHTADGLGRSSTGTMSSRSLGGDLSPLNRASGGVLSRERLGLERQRVRDLACRSIRGRAESQ
jgi:hypothetical protein